ncbi:hypothetical protein GCM10011374_23470 [Kocuria dechangensis]|uniref:Uncharacterized protein n=1 Tax=Kocuria dechangensis TaxID=1176249 RepID=A0A917LV32_9MICC|nr:hypothetical protein GCM10011374_23470 [Kocuria dechangensis]
MLAARSRQHGVTPAQTVRDFDIHELTLSQQRRQSDLGDSKKPGTLSLPFAP